jgi:hypothetical protein
MLIMKKEIYVFKVELINEFKNCIKEERKLLLDYWNKLMAVDEIKEKILKENKDLFSLLLLDDMDNRLYYHLVKIHEGIEQTKLGEKNEKA